MERRSEFFATCPPGLGRLLRDQLAATAGVEVTGRGSDGEADVALFEADRAGRVNAAALRLADGVFATAGRASRDGTTEAAALAARCWQRDGVQRALSLWAEQVQSLTPAMSYRITARMRTGPRSLRSGLRAALADVVRRDRPRWRPSGQGALEILVSEWRAGDLVTGLRVGGNRPGPGTTGPGTTGPGTTGPGGTGPGTALPPAVAAALVALAGRPDGVLLDPGCGSGLILAEAQAAGWTAEGTEPDPVLASQARSSGAPVRAGHAQEILEPDGALGACVTRLRPGTSPAELAAALAEMSRVTRSGGAVVLLAAEVPRAAWPPALRLRRQVPVRLPGGRETIWVYRRA
jgi:Methyltransferase domain